MKKVTMQHIADQLNLSKNSVSQALSGKAGVSEETRKLICDTADRLGYIYPKSKKRPVSGSGHIGLIASEFAFSQKSFFGEIFLSIQKEAAKRGMQLQIQSIDDEMKDRGNLPLFIQNKTVEGVLVLSHISTAYIRAVLATGIPTVLVDHHDPAIEADCILTNNRFGAYTAISHLIELGHRSIGFIGNIDFSPSYYERLEGYRLAMHAHRLAPDPTWLVTDADETMDHVMAIMQGTRSQPTAWFCVNDGLGFLVTSTLQQLGYAIPADISVCSFDNGHLSRLSMPMTTSMDIDLQLFGRKAVERLFWRMENPDEPCEEILLPAHLMERDSTAPLEADAAARSS